MWVTGQGTSDVTSYDMVTGAVITHTNLPGAGPYNYSDWTGLVLRTGTAKKGISGDYILDFVCLERGVIVELDGSQHADAIEHDSKRTRWLEQADFVVLRFWNNDVSNNIAGVLEVIQRTLQRRTTARVKAPVPQRC